MGVRPNGLAIARCAERKGIGIDGIKKNEERALQNKIIWVHPGHLLWSPEASAGSGILSV